MIDRESLKQSLESAGLRYTRQRRAVYETLATARDHPTAEDVFLRVRRTEPRISLATVYKTLDALESIGLAGRISAGGDQPDRFDGRPDPHYHIRCLATGQVADLPVAFDPDLLRHLGADLDGWLRQAGFQVTGYRLELLGDWQDTDPDPAAPAPDSRR